MSKISNGKFNININKIIIFTVFDGLNFSFDATLVIYINRTKRPPIITKNNIYENQNRFEIKPHISLTIITWIKIKILIDTGWLRNIKTNGIVNETNIIK